LMCQSGDGGFGYTSPGGSNGPRTAIGALVFALAKQKDGRTFKAAFQFLSTGAQTEGAYYHYYLYYASQSFFHASMQAWTEGTPLKETPHKTPQNPDGAGDASTGAPFPPATPLLSLALNSRYLPIYER